MSHSFTGRLAGVAIHNRAIWLFDDGRPSERKRRKARERRRWKKIRRKQGRT